MEQILKNTLKDEYNALRDLLRFSVDTKMQIRYQSRLYELDKMIKSLEKQLNIAIL